MAAAEPSVEYPQRHRAYVPSRTLNGDYPQIDSDPHFKRVLRFARPSDWGYAAGMTGLGVGAFELMERVSPTGVNRAGLAGPRRLIWACSVTAGFLLAYSRSYNRFQGQTENRREIDKDMKEMVTKVKNGEPLYGKSQLTEYMQGAAARQSRYSGLWLHVMPWFNLVNHNQHGVDTSKYYQEAERQLEAERTGGQ